MHEHDAEISHGFWAKNLLASGGTRPRVPRQPRAMAPPSQLLAEQLCVPYDAQLPQVALTFPWRNELALLPHSTFPGRRWMGAHLLEMPFSLQISGLTVIDPQGKASLPP